MLRIGSRHRSQVCSTEVIVVRAPGGEVALSCGGFPMVDVKAPVRHGAAPEAGCATGSLLGKRYTDADGTIEVLVTKAGDGTLALNGAPLVVKDAKPLPSSD